MSVFIKGISNHAPRQDLYKLLAKYGRILRLKTGYLDFAFVDYENEKSAFSAVKGLNGTVIFGSKVAVQIAKKNQHNNSSNNNNNDRPKPLHQNDLLYHRKDELERRPPRIIPPNLDREDKLNDKRTVIRRHDGRIIMSVDQRGGYQSSPGRGFPYRDRGSYRGRFTAARGNFRRPASYRQYSPVRSTRRDDTQRSRSVSRSRSSSRSRSRSSHSRSGSSRSSRSRSKSPARSDASKHSHSESYSPTYSPQEQPAAKRSAEMNDRTVTRRARSVEPESVRRWTVINLSHKDESHVSDSEPMVTDNNQSRSRDDLPMKEAEPGECIPVKVSSHNAPECAHGVKEASGTHHSVASSEDLRRVEERLKEEERQRAASECRLQDEQRRAEQERLQRVAAEELRAADNERAQLELQRVKQAEAERRKLMEEEWLKRIDEERQLRLVAEKSADEARARARHIEAELQRRQREDEERQREVDRVRGALLAVQQERQQWQQERQQWQAQAAHAAQETVSVQQDADTVADVAPLSKDKSHKRKAAQQLGTKPKRRKIETETEAKKAVSEKSAPNTNTSAPLVLDLTDE